MTARDEFLRHLSEDDAAPCIPLELLEGLDPLNNPDAIGILFLRLREEGKAGCYHSLAVLMWFSSMVGLYKELREKERQQEAAAFLHRVDSHAMWILREQRKGRLQGRNLQRHLSELRVRVRLDGARCGHVSPCVEPSTTKTSYWSFAYHDRAAKHTPLHRSRSPPQLGTSASPEAISPLGKLLGR